MGKPRRWTDSQLRDAVLKCSSWRQVALALGLYERGGGNYRTLQRRAEILNIETDHFTGQGWLKGKKDIFTGTSIPLSQILVENSTYTNPARLKKRLVREGMLIYKCAKCSLNDTWHGKKLSLQLDHVNGIRTDNRLENLRLLCPNCHSQTETFCKSKASVMELADMRPSKGRA